MDSITDVYEVYARTWDLQLSRYGTRERHFYPSNRQALSLSAIRSGTCISVDRGEFTARVKSRSVQFCFGGCTEAYDHQADFCKETLAIAAQFDKSPEIS